jgi:hypothetical protein
MHCSLHLQEITPCCSSNFSGNTIEQVVYPLGGIFITANAKDTLRLVIGFDIAFFDKRKTRYASVQNYTSYYFSNNLLHLSLINSTPIHNLKQCLMFKHTYRLHSHLKTPTYFSSVSTACFNPTTPSSSDVL